MKEKGTELFYSRDYYVPTIATPFFDTLLFSELYNEENYF